MGPLPKTHNGNRWIIVCIDHHSKYAETAALPRGTAEECAGFFLKNIILRHGAPSTVISDRGTPFLSKIFEQLLERCKTAHSKTTAYHPQTNGLTERMNRTLADMIAMFIEEDQKTWDELLPYVTFAYNSAVQETTGYSPFFLCHGREPATLLDSALRFPEEEKINDYDEYVQELLTHAEDARKLAITNIAQSQIKSKRVYDKHRRHLSFNQWDLVWLWTPIRKVGRATKFLKRYFGPYRIVEKHSDLTYSIEPVNSSRRRRRNAGIIKVHISRLKAYKSEVVPSGTEEALHDSGRVDSEEEAMLHLG